MEAIFAAAFLLVGVPVAVYLIRTGRFDPSDRLPPGASPWPLVVAVAWGLLAFLAAQSAYALIRGRAAGPVGATQPTTAAAEAVKPVPPPESNPRLADLPPRHVAFLATVPHAAAFLAILGFDLFVYGGHLGRLGFSACHLPRGVLLGLAYGVVFIPLVFGGAVLTEWAYRAIRYTHPNEHDLLQVLGLPGEWWVRVALVAGATVVAPLSEELLFRGHLQNFLRRALSRIGHRRGDVESADPPAPPAWAVWLAIGLTSAMFAAVHAPWTWPPIFLLSLLLGWVYERTGNLWAAVALHAAFNGVSTLLFLLARGPN